MRRKGFGGEQIGEPLGNTGEVKEDTLTYPFEKQAYRNEPMPDDLTAHESVVYSFLRNLYWSLQKGIITEDQAQKEKNQTIHKMEEGRKAREFECRLWENSAKRTMAAERSMTMYRKSRTLENADTLVERLDWLHDECALPVKMAEFGANCPICGKFFNQDHANRKPTYCEDCGCRLGWDAPNKEANNGED